MASQKTTSNGRLSRSWTSQDPIDVLRVNVEAPDEVLRQYDRFGRSLATYALLATDERTARMDATLQELVSPPEAGQDRLAETLELLAAIAENQKSLSDNQARMGAELKALTSAVAQIAAALNISLSAEPSPARQRKAASPN